MSVFQSPSWPASTSLGRVLRIPRMRASRKSLKQWSVKQYARVRQWNPSKAIAWDAIQRQRGVGLDSDRYLI
jgi:hypothetical protein